MRVQVGSPHDGGIGSPERGGYWGSCLDLGCGTGLMGPRLRPHVGSLRGVDLSPKMVDKARSKGCYDELCVGELVGFLQGQRIEGRPPVDLVVAADVLVYLGDLAPVFAAAAAVARPGCLFALSTESHDGCAAVDGDRVRGLDGGFDRGYIATLTGRFQHVRGYVECAARDAGWVLVTCEAATIRCNGGQPIAGDIFVFVLDSRAH